MTTTTTADPAATALFRAARDFLLQAADPVQAHAEFEWPTLDHFNWARDWFDAVVAKNTHDALWIARRDGDQRVGFEDLVARSKQVAAWMQQIGYQRGERVLILLRNGVPLYEVLLASIRIGVVMIPCFVSVTADECADRVRRGGIAHLIAESSLTPVLSSIKGLETRVAVGPAQAAWLAYSDSQQAPATHQDVPATRSDDLLFGYFTSGTTSLPKLALHTHTSYPVGHLSGMYWNGVRPGDVHLNVSSPGWAKHAWSSFFVPWNAEATIVVLDVDGIDPGFILDVMRRRRVSTFCAPTTIWRMLFAHGLGERPPALREATSAGEPLQPALFDAVEAAWGVKIRDGYGQTEATALIGNAPGAPIKIGAMGRAMPGYDVVLLDPTTNQTADEGEICLDLRRRRPTGLMAGYDQHTARNLDVTSGQYYRTGDFARLDDDGYITFIGRRDDIFKSFDCRISPAEIERALIGHPAIAEVAVVPSPDPIGLFVPKAFVRLNVPWQANPDMAHEIGEWMSQRLPPEHMIRRIGFVQEFPRTASGKLRRFELRESERVRALPIAALQDEYFLEADRRRA